MKLTFLKGPAKSGKTTRCVHQILQYLREPEGEPLLFLVPKQATLQTEESVFSEIPGNVRLIISDFLRLSFHFQYLLEQKNLLPFLTTQKKNIGLETIPMILQSIIQRHREELRNSAEKGSSLLDSLAEFITFLKKNNIPPEIFQKIVQNSNSFTCKDISILYKYYFNWLKEKNIVDENVGMDYSMQMLNYWYHYHPDIPLFKEVWVDGFTDFTPQQLDLLFYIGKVTENMTVTFCIEEGDTRDFWKLNKECYDTLTLLRQIPGCILEEIELPPATTEFFSEPLLFLERNWLREQIATPYPCSEHFQIIPCDNPWAEANCVAQQICEYVQNGGRYKECHILLRDIKPYKDSFIMALGKRDIPFYFDEHFSSAHHPLFNLIREILALFTPNREWNFSAFISILKTGLLPLEEEEVDEVENLMLRDVYTGASFWEQNERITQHPLFEFTCHEVIAPLLSFNSRISNSESIECESFVEALKALFSDWNIEGKLQAWSALQMNNFRRESVSSDIHSALWKRIIEWLDDISIAFKGETFLYENWCEIVEIGLRSLSITTIPPSLDQVIIADVAHSRTPMDAKFVLVAGLNEGSFPATKSESSLLSEDEQNYLQNELKKCNVHCAKLVIPRQEMWAQENYYAYIAFTRALKKLVVTYSSQDRSGKQLKPSIYVQRLQELFQNNEIEKEIVEKEIEFSEENSEVTEIKKYQISPESIKNFLGNSLFVSVSSLETYAKCPFCFFMQYILSLQEREIWENSGDKRGTLYHLTLEKFHNQIIASGKKWREFLQDSGKTESLLKEVLDESIQEVYLSGKTEIKEDDKLRDSGIMVLRNDTFFIINRYLQQLKNFFETNHFDPTIAELVFGKDKSALNWHWDVQLSEQEKVTICFRGKIDRIDVCTDSEDPENQKIWLMVMDYKTGTQTTKFKLQDFKKGTQLQLITYLNVIDANKEALYSLIASKMHEKQSEDGVCEKIPEIKPAGAFYINLRENPDSRGPQLIKQQGRFNEEIIKCGALKISEGESSQQFNVKRNKDGSLAKRPKDHLSSTEFRELLVENEENLTKIVRSIFSGNFIPTPDDDFDNGNCKYCPVKPICASASCAS